MFGQNKKNKETSLNNSESKLSGNRTKIAGRIHSKMRISTKLETSFKTHYSVLLLLINFFICKTEFMKIRWTFFIFLSIFLLCMSIFKQLKKNFKIITMTKIITQKQLIKYKIKYPWDLFIGNMLKYYVNIVRKIKCIYP